MVAGNVRARLNGLSVQFKEFPQNQIGVGSFYVDVPPLNVIQRIDLKTLFQKAGVPTKDGQDSSAAVDFLTKLLALADSAGGDAPRSAGPDTQAIRELQMLSGNAQLLAIHGKKAELEGYISSWKKAGDGIAKRLPAWERLLEFNHFANGLSESKDWAESIEAITKNRSLLNEPDPIQSLIHKVVQVLREAITKLQKDVTDAFALGEARLEKSDEWARLKADQRKDLTARFQLMPPAIVPLGTEQDILTALRSSSLSERHNLLDAIPQRFTKALEEAAQLLEPTAVRITLPSATIKNEAELDNWLDDAREQIAEKLKDGPVIL